MVLVLLSLRCSQVNIFDQICEILLLTYDKIMRSNIEATIYHVFGFLNIFYYVDIPVYLHFMDLTTKNFNNFH